MTSTNYAVYCRISSDRDNHRLGVERQKAECLEYAQEHGLTVAGVYVDNSISAAGGAVRPDYQRLLSDIEAGQISGILVWSLDRLYRRVSELEDLVALVEKTGVHIYAVKAGKFDLSSPTGLMIARIAASVANYETDHTAERIAASHRSRASQGRYRGGAVPFGYRRGDETGTLVIDENETRHVRDAAKAILDGKGLFAITAEWNALGLTTARGNKWDSTALRRLLLSPTIAGLVTHRGEIIGPASWPAILPRHEWERLVRELKAPERKTNFQGNARKHMGSGVYECSLCGSLMARQSPSKKVPESYRCKGCRRLSVPKEPVDEYVSALIKARIRSDILAEVEFFEEKDAPPVEDLIERRQELINRQDALAEMFATGAITGTALMAGSRKLDQEITALDDEISTGPTNPRPALEMVEESWEKSTPDQKAGVIKALMRVIVLPVGRGRRARIDERVRIEWK